MAVAVVPNSTIITDDASCEHRPSCLTRQTNPAPSLPAGFISRIRLIRASGFLPSEVT